MRLSVAEPLRGFVSSAVAYDVAAGLPGAHRGMPSTTVTFVLPLGDPLDLAWADDPGSRGRTWSVVAGLHARPALLRHDGAVRGVELALTPRGVRVLLGLPAGELAGRMLELDDVAPHLRGLVERTADAAGSRHEDGPRTAAAVVCRALADVVARREAPRPAATERALALLASGTTAAGAARALGCSRRRLHQVVSAETGHSPTAYRRIARFERARRVLVRSARVGPALTLADVAARTGFADQAHLCRDFAAFAGCTPSTWLREEFPNLQDRLAPDGAGWG